MRLDPQAFEAATRTLKRFRVGGAAIAAIPLVCAFIHLGGSDRAESMTFSVMSGTLLFLVLWIGHCAERLLKTLQQGSPAAATE